MSSENRVKIEEYYHKRLLYTLLLGLTLQKEGGTMSLLVMTFEEKITNDVIYILSCCYNSVIVQNNRNGNPLSFGITIICIDFKGIDNTDLEKLYTEMKISENTSYITSIISNKYNQTDCSKKHFEYISNKYKDMNNIYNKINKLDDINKDKLSRELLPIQYSLMVKWYDQYYSI